MSGVDWSLLPPSPWTDEERAAFLRRAQEDRMRRGYNPSFEESRRILETWVADAETKRGYKLTTEEKERRFFQLVFEARVIERRRRSEAEVRAFEYRYTAPRGPLMVREGGSGETQLDRIERAAGAMRVRLEAFESNIHSYVDQMQVVAAKLEELTGRVGALAQAVERLDRRVLSLEHRVVRVEERVERLDGGAG